MYDSTYEALPAIIVHEGSTRHMYLDRNGFVTTGKGNLIDDSGKGDPAAPAVALPWVDTSTNDPADEATIRTQWQTVKGRTDLASSPAGGADPAWAAVTTIRLSDAAVDQLVNKSAHQIGAQLEALHPSVSTAPADAQLAAMRWAWALGPQPIDRSTGKPAYPMMWAAFDSGDYLAAAQQAHWVGEDPQVAILIGQLFQNAADVVANGLDYAAVVWPNSVNQPSLVSSASEPSLPTFGGDANLAATLATKAPKARDVGSAKDAIKQGSAVLDAAYGIATALGNTADGPAAPAMIAAQLIVSELPPGEVTTALNDYVNAGQAALEGATTGAAIGAALGFVFPGLGNLLGAGAGAEIGAVVGASVSLIRDVLPWIEHDHFNVLLMASDAIGVVKNAIASLDPFSGNTGSVINDVLSAPADVAQDFLGLFSSNSRPPQPDFRFLSDKECFPATTSDAPMGLIPGVFMHNPRCNSQSTFYQTPNGPNQAWSLAFNFLTSWHSPVKWTNPAKRAKARQAAFALAQYYTQAYSARLGRKPTMTFQQLASFFARPREATTAYNKMVRWCGDPASFDTALPFGGNDPKGTGLAAKVGFEACPMDMLYYPVPTNWDGSAQIDRPSKLNKANGVYMVPSTFRISLAELAVIGGNDAQAYHFAVQHGLIWKRGRDKERKIFGDLDVAHHPDIARVVGLTSSLVAKACKKASFSYENSLSASNNGAILAISAIGVIGLLSHISKEKT